MKLRLALYTIQNRFLLTALLILIFVPYPLAAKTEDTNVVQAAPGQSVTDFILLEAQSEIINAPNDIELGDLNPEVHYSKQGTLEIKGLGHWNIIVSSDGQPNTGYMSEYDTSTGQYIGYNGKQLANTMKIRAVDEDGTLLGQVDLKTGGQLLQGTGNSLKSCTIYFDQVASWDDEPLTQDHIYRIVVTFKIERVQS
jgi:hypothetical protein